MAPWSWCCRTALPRSERAHGFAGHDEDADRLPLAQERHAENRAVVAEALIFARGILGVRENIGDMDGSPVARDSRRGAMAARRERMRARISREFLGIAKVRNPLKEVPLALENRRLLRLA